MRKDKKWLRDEVSELYPSYDEMYVSPDYETVAKTETISKVLELIDQLDEPEQTEQSPTQSMIEQVLEVFFTVVTELDERESPLTFKEFVYQSLEKLDEPEVLSQEWVDENVIEGDFRGEQEFWYGRFIEEEKVRNLLVPEQDNGFVVFEKDKLDEEVQRMIDETYKAMSEKPVIPQFVADYYKDYEHLELTFEEWFGREEFEAGSKTENKTFEWLLDNSHEVNIERQFILADIIAHGLDGYEVEKEKLYHVVNKENYFMLRKDDGLVVTVVTMQVSPAMSRDKYGKDTRFMLTEKEIKDYDERYWAFAQEVTE
ncbi:DUF1642 domain-containing protein [Jeotgalibaca porci]|uniref:DUF1642 domain-containing protein n=1 Tax=Jeotgalibaca porci TaxID=1868793 RepID=UPI00359F636A